MKELQSIFDFFETTEIDIKKSKIAADLCALLAYCELSRTDIADKLGREKSYISRMLSGKQNLTIKSILEFCLALDYDFEVTFFNKENDRPRQPWQVTSEVLIAEQENIYITIVKELDISESLSIFNSTDCLDFNLEKESGKYFLPQENNEYVT